MPVTLACFPSAELAQSSQEHLQRTVKYGGRLRLPSPGETQALLVLGEGGGSGGYRRLGIMGLPGMGQGAGASGHWWTDPTTCLGRKGKESARF